MSSSPPTPPNSKVDFDHTEEKSKDTFQSPSVAALGNSEAIGGAAAIAVVTASAIPLINQSVRRNSRVSASRTKDMSRCVSATSATSRQMDGDSSVISSKSTTFNSILFFRIIMREKLIGFYEVIIK